MKSLSHLDKSGKVTMVDVGAKPDQHRRAVATATLHCAAATIRLLKKKALPKGDVLVTAQIAGIQAAKQTATLIPLCHPLPLHKIDVQFKVASTSITVTAEAVTIGKTGVEMEALTAASVACLTLYDMLKAVDKSMRVDGLRVVKKEKRS